MNLIRTALVAVIGGCVGAAALEGFHRFAPPSMNAGGGMEETIHRYVVSHPEILQEAMAELEKRQNVADAEKGRAAVKNNAQLIFNSPRQVTLGDKSGDVTLVEFFDYNCPYCKHAHGDLTSLMKSDTKLRVVLKELPVLGPGSVEAAQVAVALRMQDPSGEKYLAFHEKLLGIRGQANGAKALDVAQDVGADMDRLKADLKSDEVKASIDESRKLAEDLGLNGTPSYVIGPDVVVGAVGLDTLKDKVKSARCSIGVTTAC
jgi:protein-disulfide isomerase